MRKDNFYILTGGPGSGKTTVLNILDKLGYMTIEEGAREIIQKQIATTGDGVPWGNTIRYAKLMLLRSILDFEEASHIDSPCFFDRGIIDTVGYARLIQIPITEEMKTAVQMYQYHHRVFLFPFWKEIYEKDKERQQNEEEAEKTYLALKKEYEDSGYEIIEVPLLTPQKRAEWILDRIRRD